MNEIVSLIGKCKQLEDTMFSEKARHRKTKTSPCCLLYVGTKIKKKSLNVILITRYLKGWEE